MLDELEERSERPERRRRTPLIAVAAAAVAALVTASAMWLAFDDDRDLADRYRETLAVANGKYLAAARRCRPRAAVVPGRCSATRATRRGCS